MARKSKQDKEVEELQEFLKPTGAGFLRVEDGESVVVYFTEDFPDIPKAWRHSKRIQYRGRWYEFTCLGEGCPLCEHPDENMRRRSRRGRFVTVLQDSSISLRDFGVKFMQQLLAVYEEEGTILGTPFKITRRGSGRATSWTVVPVSEKKYPKPRGVKKSEIGEANENAHKEYEEREPDEILGMLKKGYTAGDSITEVDEEDEDLTDFLGSDEGDNEAW